MGIARLATFLWLAWIVPCAAAEVASYVGAKACGGCHQAETEAWAGSHHAKAMAPADPANVLGDFNDASVTHYGVTSTFTRKGDEFWVRTDGPDGAPHDYRIAYTFGVYPLQQYLIAFPGGRLQALGIAWDARPKDAGGQRWFHLYPGQAVAHGDRLHWTGRDQNWNYMCADCHSTDLARNYDPASDTYKTSWSDIDVACEACHGPASRHLAWAKGDQKLKDDPAKGLAVRLGDWDGGVWQKEEGARTAQRSLPRADHTEIEVCAPCHSRRSELVADGAAPGSYLDRYHPALISPDLYFPDGQIREEVYEYGSFLQSRMYMKGVTCSNCHEPHTLQLRAEGNGVCAQCHEPAIFDTPAHHHHKAGTEAAACVSCHMPTRTYMVVDARRDHAIRVPRPDLSVALGTPNACTGCHGDKTAEWAVDALAGWYGPNRRNEPHYGTVFGAAEAGRLAGRDGLPSVAQDAARPPIVRASAMALMPPFVDVATPEMIKAYLAGFRSEDPLIRMASVGALDPFSPEERAAVAAPLLKDPVRAVRAEAAFQLAPAHDRLDASARAAFDAAAAEFVAAQQATAERPESALNLGNFYAALSRPSEAEAAYRQALRLDPKFIPALVNMADLFRALGRDQEGEDLLNQALAIEPNDADANFAEGLLLVRQHRLDQAIDHLARAAKFAPGNGRYAYVYAVALNSSGAKTEAFEALRAAHGTHPTDRDILMGLASFARDSNNKALALDYANQLLNLVPTDPEAQSLVRSLSQ